MTRRRRWALVCVVAAAVVAVPTARPAWPVDDPDVSARDLRTAIARSDEIGWSGEVRTRGTLQVPDTSSFGTVARLLGEESTLRVWWRSQVHWRVDRIRATGESDLVRDGGRMIRWTFESRRATVARFSDVRLPDDSDLLPSRLAARLLSGSTAREIERIPARRVAGRTAPGLRLTPADSRSTIRRADIWADERTGLPLRVEVFGDAGRPVVTSRFTDVDLTAPGPRTTTFIAGPRVDIRGTDSLDVAAAANAFAPFDLPDAVAGLERGGAPERFGAAGVYGRGPTALLVVPLRRKLSGQVRDQLDKASGARQDVAGTALEVGPLSVLLTPRARGRGTFLLAGTVTPQTLVDAATELRAGASFR